MLKILEMTTQKESYTLFFIIFVEINFDKLKK